MCYKNSCSALPTKVGWKTEEAKGFSRIFFFIRNIDINLYKCVLDPDMIQLDRNEWSETLSPYF